MPDDIRDVDGPTPQSNGDDVARVGVAIELSTRDQSRVSVLFRLLLLIPFHVFLQLWAVAVFVVAVISWFAAMWSGRVPAALRRFMVSFLQFTLEYQAFAALLTSRLPGLPNPEARGPRPELEIDEVDQSWPGLLFRIVLAVPAYVMSVVFLAGASVYAIIMWFSEIVTRRAPENLHVANALAVRFYIRTSSYLLLLTPTQPFVGAFGDTILGDEVASQHEPPVDAPPAPAYQPSSIAPLVTEPTDDVAEPVTDLDPWAKWSVHADSSTLSKVALAVGVIALVAYSVIGYASRDLFKSPSADAILATKVVYLDVAFELAHVSRSVTACTTLPCVQTAAQEGESAVLGFIDTFQTSAASKSPPQPEYRNYLSSLNAIATTLSDMSTAASLSEAYTSFSDLPHEFVQAGRQRDRLIAAF
jgi:hypothetical protein